MSHFKMNCFILRNQQESNLWSPSLLQFSHFYCLCDLLWCTSYSLLLFFFFLSISFVGFAFVFVVVTVFFFKFSCYPGYQYIITLHRWEGTKNKCIALIQIFMISLSVVRIHDKMSSFPLSCISPSLAVRGDLSHKHVTEDYCP